MVKSLVEKMEGTRMTEIISRKEDRYSQINPIQRLFQNMGIRAYTPEGHKIVKMKKEISRGKVKLRTFVEKTGETIYEAIYISRGIHIQSTRKFQNYKLYQEFNPYYNLTI